MKKFKLVIIAVVLAIGFSAFTTNTVDDQAYYFDNSTMSYQPVPSGTVVCPQGQSDQCLTTVNGVANTPLYINFGAGIFRKQ